MLFRSNIHNGRAGKASAYVGPLDRGPPEGCSWALMPPSCGKPREGPSPHATAGGVAGREVALRRKPSAHPELRSRKETQCLPRMEMQEGVGSPARGECRVTSQPEEVCVCVSVCVCVCVCGGRGRVGPYILISSEWFRTRGGRIAFPGYPRPVMK